MLFCPTVVKMVMPGDNVELEVELIKTIVALRRGWQVRHP